MNLVARRRDRWPTSAGFPTQPTPWPGGGHSYRRRVMKAATRAAFLVLTLYATSALARPVALSDNQLNQIVAGEDFTIVNEVSDLGGTPTTDPLLVNPWGLSQASAAGPLWVANNGTGTSTLYNFSTFAKIPLNV